MEANVQSKFKANVVLKKMKLRKVLKNGYDLATVHHQGASIEQEKQTTDSFFVKGRLIYSSHNPMEAP